MIFKELCKKKVKTEIRGFRERNCVGSGGQSGALVASVLGVPRGRASPAISSSYHSREEPWRYFPPTPLILICLPLGPCLSRQWPFIPFVHPFYI